LCFLEVYEVQEGISTSRCGDTVALGQKDEKG